MDKTLLILIVVFSISCKNNQNIKVASETLKAVPKVYIDASHPRFLMHQDTIYFNYKRFSGIQYQLFPAGDTAFIKPFLNGLEEGVVRKWYPNKQIAEERLYINGKKEGTHRGWWENGKQKFEFEVSSNEYTNEFKEWDSKGLLIKYFHYKNGQEAGSQKLFYENGKVKANYIIINGKRYGLLGTKNCKNVSDSIFTAK